MKKIFFAVLFLSFNSFAGSFCDGNFYIKTSKSFRVGYVAGVWDSMEFQAATLGDKGAKKFVDCIDKKDPSLTTSQLADLLTNHYVAHPEDRGSNCAPKLLEVAFKAWKCN